ncbi:MAG TPA: phosphatidylserine decarboxylase, partial [Rhodanobacteraceae bacterium]
GSNGPFAVVLVGAMLVSGITTVWNGNEVPPYARRVARRDWRARSVQLARGAEMARFEMGSTVIVLVPFATPDPRQHAEAAVTVGQSLAHLSPARATGTIAAPSGSAGTSQGTRR